VSDDQPALLFTSKTEKFVRDYALSVDQLVVGEERDGDFYYVEAVQKPFRAADQAKSFRRLWRKRNRRVSVREFAREKGRPSDGPRQ